MTPSSTPTTSFPAVSFQGVTKSFGQEVVLKDISVDLFSEELTFIMGPSGVGKSVFLKLALGFETPDSGTVLLEGKNIHGLHRRQMRILRSRNILIFQKPALFDFLTVIQNVCFPYLEYHIRKSVKQAYKHGEEILHSLGYQSDVHKTTEEVTESEAKIVAAARALMMDPTHLFFDEPTTGLDEITRARVDHEIKQVNKHWKKGCTVISHDVRSAMAIADRVLFLHEQRIHEDSHDPHSLLRSSDAVTKNFFQPGMLF